VKDSMKKKAMIALGHLINKELPQALQIEPQTHASLWIIVLLHSHNRSSCGRGAAVQEAGTKERPRIPTKITQALFQ